ncbi:unnamed protein product [Parnassius apollo]|uniref:(apollo) hypothetical protein n=1 Tax=Parnassius apollo TaxID=110799 RepID=A0A8S3YAS2_PARAO|nr:unnamed protein product [Parnassius apollo]
MKNRLFADIYTFEQQFKATSLSLYTLEKDMCDICTSYTAGNLSEAEYQMHIIEKDRARHEKEIDKKKVADGNISDSHEDKFIFQMTLDYFEAISSVSGENYFLEDKSKQQEPEATPRLHHVL